ncbi:MAG: hypothetical protein ABJE95_19610 [Byssovorax sp.]
MPAIPPCPSEDPEAWDTLALGPNKFPPRYPGAGRAKVTCDGGAEVTQIKANGKDGASTQIKGRKVCDVSFEIGFPRSAWKEGMAFFLAIDPQGAGYGKVWETPHPACAVRGANKVLLETLSGVVATGDMFTFSGKGSGWNAPDKPKGGTSTPKKAEKWVDKKPDDPTHTTAVLSNGNKIDFGTGQVGTKTSEGNTYGVDGPNGPTENP